MRSKNSQIELNQDSSGLTKPNQNQPVHTKPDKTKPDSITPNQT